MNDGQEQRRAKGTAVRSDVRTRLLDATISVLDTAGPEAATSRAIADAAGENLASITYYFGSKRELVNEAMITATRRLIQPVVVEFADDGRDSIAKLLSAVQQLYRILDAHGTLLGPYVQSSPPPQPTTQSPPKCDHCIANSRRCSLQRSRLSNTRVCCPTGWILIRWRNSSCHWSTALLSASRSTPMKPIPQRSARSSRSFSSPSGRRRRSPVESQPTSPRMLHPSNTANHSVAARPIRHPSPDRTAEITADS